MEEKVSPGNCSRCKQHIHPKDNFCRLTEWKQGKQIGEGWYHTHCFREGMHGKVEEKHLKDQAQALLDKANKLVGKMEEDYGRS